MADTTGGALTPDEQAAQIRQLIQLASDSEKGNYVTAASLVLLIHDIILTLPREVRRWLFFLLHISTMITCKVELVWNYRLSKSSILFVIMRYGNAIVQGIGLAYYLWPNPPYTFCKVWFYSEEWVSDILFIPVSIFLGLRTYALYRGQGAFYKWFIYAVVMITNLILVVSLSVATAQIKWFDMFLHNFWTARDRWTSSIHSFSIFVLSAVRCYQHYKQGNIRIIKIIFKSCLAYFAFLFTSGLTSLILYKTLPNERAALRGILINPMRTVAVIITSRMVLSIRTIVLTGGPLTTEDLTAFLHAGDHSTASSTSLQWRMASRRHQTSTGTFEMDERHDSE
ncbi:hypothetical protein B0H17DRAFT_1199589 [Mycena rosella]|uniref:DUF6533 domain-containing protein n=1 Tax=Mycena rosella TaxID=1033263 RepID=A0AAD7GLU9_MYCRO|nr:hypothetical protein B0H17DRAFT_1199589 [Mycena rosella]